MRIHWPVRGKLGICLDTGWLAPCDGANNRTIWPTCSAPSATTAHSGRRSSCRPMVDAVAMTEYPQKFYVQVARSDHAVAACDGFGGHQQGKRPQTLATSCWPCCRPTRPNSPPPGQTPIISLQLEDTPIAYVDQQRHHGRTAPPSRSPPGPRNRWQGEGDGRGKQHGAADRHLPRDGYYLGARGDVG